MSDLAQDKINGKSGNGTQDHLISSASYTDLEKTEDTFKRQKKEFAGVCIVVYALSFQLMVTGA